MFLNVVFASASSGQGVWKEADGRGGVRNCSSHFGGFRRQGQKVVNIPNKVRGMVFNLYLQ
jgi:hypothetical protein